MQEQFKLESFCRVYDVSRSRAYEDIKRGILKVIKIGRSSYISAAAAKTWLEHYQNQLED